MINCTYLVPFRQSSEKQLDFTWADVNVFILKKMESLFNNLHID